MKIALYIEDGIEQIMLTPQSQAERDILDKMSSGNRTMKIYRGEFYHCKGGWHRWGEPPSAQFVTETRDLSTIIVLTPPPDSAIVKE